MKQFAVSIFLAMLCAAPLLAGDLSHEIELNYSYVGGAETNLSPRRNGSVSEQSSLVHYVASKQFGDGPIFRVGMDWQRYDFSAPAFARIPVTLQSNNLILGMDLALSGFLIRIEAQPGFYGDGDNFRGKDFNVPFVIGGSYIVSGDLQWIAGIRVDLNSQYPVFGAVGMRWRLSEKWVLDAILPRPRLEYELNKSLTLFGGAELKDGTYRVGSDFGTTHRNPALNDAVLDYTEVRTGVGASWKISSAFKVDIETGYMAYREFNFHRTSTDIKSESGAAYGQIIIGSQF